MPRTFVADIQPQMQVEEVYRIVDRQLRANRQGNLYLLMQLQDKTGTISAMRWNADEKLAERFGKGSFVRIQAASQLHNGILQLIVNQMASVPSEQLSMDDFEAAERVDFDGLWGEVQSIVGAIQNDTLKAICSSFLEDKSVFAALRIAPAGIKAHHAYPGGLLEHMVSLMKMANFVAGHYTDLDASLLVAGAFIHDIGKIEEMAFDGELGYTDAGQLLGHLVQGVQMIDRKVNELQAKGVAIDHDLVLRLQHIVVSHHGCLEHGSPKVPMTLEAIAFHYLDEMDAKLNSARSMISTDRTKDAWTSYNPTLGRKILKPVSTSET